MHLPRNTPTENNPSVSSSYAFATVATTKPPCDHSLKAPLKRLKRKNRQPSTLTTKKDVTYILCTIHKTVIYRHSNNLPQCVTSTSRQTPFSATTKFPRLPAGNKPNHNLKNLLFPRTLKEPDSKPVSSFIPVPLATGN
jgi:hypothetical protein